MPHCAHMKLTCSLALFLFFAASLLLPSAALGNGGDQRVVAGGKYLVNLSRAPFTPRAGEKNSMIFSFGDVRKDAIITEPMLVNIRIAKVNDIGPHGERQWLLQQEHILVKTGALDFPYTFARPGLHEIFVEFAFAANSTTVYMAPDFLLDIQPPVVSKADASCPATAIAPTKPFNPANLLVGIAGAALGFIGGRLVKRKGSFL